MYGRKRKKRIKADAFGHNFCRSNHNFHSVIVAVSGTIFSNPYPL